MPRDDLIQLRNGTTAEWAEADPVLALGEPGLDTTVRAVKYGDGVRPWSLLPYSGLGGGEGGDGGLALMMHIEDPTPHPAYDDMPDLAALVRNRLV